MIKANGRRLMLKRRSAIGCYACDPRGSQRNSIGRGFCSLGLASGILYDGRTVNFIGFIHLAAAMICGSAPFSIAARIVNC
ncbi:hypothetical protein ACM43_10965 [Bradyrhizobium sp. CCBAU 45321]|uniref:hypothetical protein n=1 Tax=Bradyrhizobium TaxID=374 RepID=UPI000569F812|nr:MULTISPECIES: hypothetical protein [Bradyrhizobium]MCA1544925.1 hypothetical protein [Bradyrhizobium sp. NBAIM32]MDA9544989.1 hypothetical protein [Bradyrhizobium sp. CCBAU 45321]